MAGVAQPFDPIDFLQIAGMINYQLSGEAALRTAVGRAYYSLFLIARQRTGIGAGPNIHQRVIREVKKRDATTGQQLDTLRRLRTTADYEMAPSDPQYQNWAKNWSRADLITLRVLPKIQTI